MGKEEIKEWLKNNSEKTSQEIEEFLLSEMNGEDFKEYWHKHYFLEDLKSSTNDFSKNILKAINNTQKEINGVPMWKRFLAFDVDWLIWGLFCSILFLFPINPESAVGIILILLVYIIYVSVNVLKFRTTAGLFLFKIKIEFEKENFLLIRIIAREILFFTVGTGIGFIFYLISGPYWDRITGARVVWIKK